MALETAPVSRKSDICSATCSATFSCASFVAAPRCGVQTTFSKAKSGLSVAGSTSNTSKAAPAKWPDCSASASATSSTKPPRAQLISRAPFFMRAIFSRERILRVCSVMGVCSVMKSARASNSGSSTFSTPISTARFSERKGSKAMTFIFNPLARSATMPPILPQPIRPRVFAKSSTPMKRFFSHLPALVEAEASGNCRASANIIAMACSAVVIALPKGVFITTTPRAVALVTSTLSTPMPARPTTFSRGAACSTSRVTLVAERTAKPSYSPMMARSSAGVRPVLTSASMPRSRKIATAAGLSLSEIRTRGMGLTPLPFRLQRSPAPNPATAAAP